MSTTTLTHTTLIEADSNSLPNLSNLDFNTSSPPTEIDSAPAATTTTDTMTPTSTAAIPEIGSATCAPAATTTTDTMTPTSTAAIPDVPTFLSTILSQFSFRKNFLCRLLNRRTMHELLLLFSYHFFAFALGFNMGPAGIWTPATALCLSLLSFFLYRWNNAYANYFGDYLVRAVSSIRPDHKKGLKNLMEKYRKSSRDYENYMLALSILSAILYFITAIFLFITGHLPFA